MGQIYFRWMKSHKNKSVPFLVIKMKELVAVRNMNILPMLSFTR